MGLKENLQADPVSRLALRDPVIAASDDSIREGIARMRRQELGCVIVVDEDRRPQGIFTESMLRQLLAAEPTAVNERLGDHMNRDAKWVRLNEPVSQVLRSMQTENTRFVGVVDEDGRLVGLTGQKGLMEYVAEHFPQQVMVQRVARPPHFVEREGA
ncbi:MAG: CBS domain-containing protein [Pirellulales bacterium]